MISYLGVRHHGPGSAASVVAALDELAPVAVLIEGPADATAMLPLLADAQMAPPVALLGYSPDEPAHAAFWPFAEFSPEYQAALWALRRGVRVEFIDLPVLALLDDGRDETATEPADDGAEAPEPAADASGSAEPGAGQDDQPSGDVAPSGASNEAADPISALAAAAGYEDPESWWADLIEQNPAPGPIFAAVAEAMAQFREDAPTDGRDLRREAHMRRAIASVAKDVDGPVAVVCGALHVPALQGKASAGADRALLTGLPRKSAAITWAPWTNARLSFSSGYGAGVAAPGWNEHLWQCRATGDVSTRWLTRIAAELRAAGHLVSTASLIEAQRLAVALASLRDRPQPGFEELREAAVAVLFGGDPVLWQLIEAKLLVGARVGAIPDGVPLAPLIEDLQRQQRLTRLKPEALERELAIDLRTESGAARSALLHRLRILGVSWGKLTDAGRSRGTFRERWVLAWQPEFAVDLVEKLVYGSTIEQAASGLLAEQLNQATALGDLARGCERAMTAGLPAAVEVALKLLADKAALSSDTADMLAAVPPLADVMRYGQARQTDAGALGSLVERLITDASMSLHYSTRGLDDEAAANLTGLVVGVDQALRLLADDVSSDCLTAWDEGLADVIDDDQAAPQVAGCCAQLRYQAGSIDSSEVVVLVRRRLSPGTATLNAAGFLEGFFTRAAARLIFDDDLRGAVSGWLGDLDDDDFMASLPLLRRVFSELDKSSRRQLIAAALGTRSRQMTNLVLAPDDGAGWRRHEAIVMALVKGGDGDGRG